MQIDKNKPALNSTAQAHRQIRDDGSRAPGLCLPGNKYFPFVTIQGRGRVICKPYQIFQGGSKSAVTGFGLPSVRRRDLQAVQMQESRVPV